MRRVRYQVACSLDGYIAGPDGGIDWIVADPEIDFAAIFAEYDTFLMGRHTWEALEGGGGGMGMEGEVVVFSRTLPPEDHPSVRVVADDAADVVRELKARDGEDIWLFGGGKLFRSLLEAGLVDSVEPAIIPVVLGGGVPMVPPGTPRTTLRLAGRTTYAASGIVLLRYDVVAR